MRGWNRLTCEPRKSGNGGPSFDTLKSVFTTVLAVRVIAMSFEFRRRDLLNFGVRPRAKNVRDITAVNRTPFQPWQRTSWFVSWHKQLLRLQIDSESNTKGMKGKKETSSLYLLSKARKICCVKTDCTAEGQPRTEQSTYCPPPLGYGELDFRSSFFRDKSMSMNSQHPFFKNRSDLGGIIQVC